MTFWEFGAVAGVLAIAPHAYKFITEGWANNFSNERRELRDLEMAELIAKQRVRTMLAQGVADRVEDLVADPKVTIAQLRGYQSGNARHLRAVEERERERTAVA